MREDTPLVSTELVGSLNFDSAGLIPAVVIDRANVVLMVAWMDEEALRRTIASGRTWYYSRSRKEYWAKGETSGNVQLVDSIIADCDLDTLVVKVRQIGEGACHTGSYSCFFNAVAEAVLTTDSDD